MIGYVLEMRFNQTMPPAREPFRRSAASEFLLAFRLQLWQKQSHDSVIHGRRLKEQAGYTDFICL